LTLTFQNEFLVDAPVDLAWRTLLDLQRVAQCLPGASIEAAGQDGSFPGSMRFKLGPMTLTYRGVARIEQVDEASYTATFAVEGQETKGQGSASATIASRLATDGLATRVFVESTLTVTGRPAQFGGRIMEDVAAGLLADFAKRLSEMMKAETEPAAPSAEPRLGRGSQAPRPSATSALPLTTLVWAAWRRRISNAIRAASPGRLVRRSSK
jgi:carbon monoxide dehydrogenase subunit G